MRKDPSEPVQDGNLIRVFGPEAGLLAVYSPERKPLLAPGALAALAAMWVLFGAVEAGSGQIRPN